MKKNLLLYAYLLTEFSDFKFFSDDNSFLFQIITLEDLHGSIKIVIFLEFTHFSLQIHSILNKQFYDEIF